MLFWLWGSIAFAVGLAAISLWLSIVDHREYKKLWTIVEELKERIQRWEGWGRLVCAIAVDAKLDLPKPPESINECGSK